MSSGPGSASSWGTVGGPVDFTFFKSLFCVHLCQDLPLDELAVLLDKERFSEQEIVELLGSVRSPPTISHKSGGSCDEVSHRHS